MLVPSLNPTRTEALLPNLFGLPNGFGMAGDRRDARTEPCLAELVADSLESESPRNELITGVPILWRAAGPRGRPTGKGAATMVRRTRSSTDDRNRPTAARPGNGASASLQKLRAERKQVAEDGLLLATLRIRIRKNGPWTGAFTRAHPQVTMEVLNRSEVSKDVSVSDYWISGRPPGVWAREIADYPDVVKVDSLAEVGDGSIYRTSYRNPPIIYLYRKLRLPLHFPFQIQGGYIRWEVVARRSEFDAVVRYARKVDPDFQLLSIRRRPLRSHLPVLTETQQQLLNQAMAAGYFAVPRAITLTDLARRLDRSKSSVSEAIAVIERKLLESALRPPTIYSQ
jgi:predicted DNA binding protein